MGDAKTFDIEELKPAFIVVYGDAWQKPFVDYMRGRTALNGSKEDSAEEA